MPSQCLAGGAAASGCLMASKLLCPAGRPPAAAQAEAERRDTKRCSPIQFLRSGGRFWPFRTGFRPDYCRGSAKIVPPAGRRPAGGTIFALPRQKAGRKPVRKGQNRPPPILKIDRRDPLGHGGSQDGPPGTQGIPGGRSWGPGGSQEGPLGPQGGSQECPPGAQGGPRRALLGCGSVPPTELDDPHPPSIAAGVRASHSGHQFFKVGGCQRGV